MMTKKQWESLYRVWLGRASAAERDRDSYVKLWKQAANHAIDLIIERNGAYRRLGEIREYVERVHGQAEAASEQVRRVAASGVAESWAELLDLLDAPLGVVLGADRKDDAA